MPRVPKNIVYRERPQSKESNTDSWHTDGGRSVYANSTTDSWHTDGGRSVYTRHHLPNHQAVLFVTKETLPCINRLISETCRTIRELERDTRTTLARASYIDDFIVRWVTVETEKIRYDNTVQPLFSRLRRLEFLKNSFTKEKSVIGEETKQRAKEKDIEKVAESLGLKVKHHKALCPFHNERTPSFIFLKNKYRCYGCGVFGDTIDLYQKLSGKSWTASVHDLAGL